MNRWPDTRTPAEWAIWRSHADRIAAYAARREAELRAEQQTAPAPSRKRERPG